MLVHIQNHPQQEPTSCKVVDFCFQNEVAFCRSHISRRVLDFSELLVQLLSHQIIPLFFSPRTRSQVMFALLCHVRFAQYCCMFCPRFFVFVFSFVIVLVFVRSACCNFYFYIVFVFQIAIVLVFVLTE